MEAGMMDCDMSGWQASWLANYGTSATNAPVELRCSAQCLANSLLDQKFVQEPGFRVMSVPGCGC